MCGRVEALPCGGRCKDAAVRVSGRWCSINVGDNGRGRQRSILTSRSDQPLEHGAERRRGSLPSSFSWNLLLLLSSLSVSHHHHHRHHHQFILQSTVHFPSSSPSPLLFIVLFPLSPSPSFSSLSFSSLSFSSLSSSSSFTYPVHPDTFPHPRTQIRPRIFSILLVSSLASHTLLFFYLFATSFLFIRYFFSYLFLTFFSFTRQFFLTHSPLLLHIYL